MPSEGWEYRPQAHMDETRCVEWLMPFFEVVVCDLHDILVKYEYQWLSRPKTVLVRTDQTRAR